MPTVLQGLRNFLIARRATHNAPDLIDRWGPGMETQVNTIRGAPVEGRKNTFTDGMYEWHPIRIPKNAYSEPEFYDYPLRYPFDLYAEGIGMTGWDWKNRVSRHLGFDFDALTHKQGLTPEQLEQVKAVACAIPWLEVRKSTGGKGLHLYVSFSQPIPCPNHTIHASYAQSVLALMTKESGFDFAASLDVAGGNMWIWHRKMTPENEGLKLIKPAERGLTLAELPERDAGRVVLPANSRQTTLPPGNLNDAIKAMRRIKIADGNDGSRRLYTYCCRAVAHNLTDEETIQAIRTMEEERPFSK